MKKNLSIICLILVMLSVSALAQSNLTWKFKDQLQKGAIKTTKVLNTSFSGFASNAAALSFYQKMKTYEAFTSCELVSSNASSCDLKLVMKQTHDKTFYASLAQKMGVSFIEVNGTKKTPQEILSKKK
jgi:hypothetical protein